MKLSIKNLTVFERVSPKAFLGIAIFTIALIALFIFFSSRSYSTLTSQNRIELTVPYADAHVFLNDDRVAITTEDNEVVTIDRIKDGVHAVTVAKNDHRVWVRTFDFNITNSFKGDVFLIPQKPDTSDLRPDGDDYRKIDNLITNQVLPTSTSTARISEDTTARLWFEDNLLFLETGVGIQTVTQTKKPIRNVSFYKDHNNIFIVEEGNAIYAIGNIGESKQPIYTGTRPEMYPESSSLLYVRDGNKIFHLEL